MAQTITIPAGGSSLVLNGNSITEFASGDIVELTFDNNLAERHYGTGGRVNINERVDAAAATLVFRVMRYQDDDVVLSGMLNAADVTVINGSLQEQYIADGTDATGNWILAAGNFMKHTDKTINNEEGEPMVEYTIACVAKRNV